MTSRLITNVKVLVGHGHVSSNCLTSKKHVLCLLKSTMERPSYYHGLYGWTAYIPLTLKKLVKMVTSSYSFQWVLQLRFPKSDNIGSCMHTDTWALFIVSWSRGSQPTFLAPLCRQTSQDLQSLDLQVLIFHRFVAHRLQPEKITANYYRRCLALYFF